MKKPTNPLPLNLCYGGFLVLPLLKAFEGQSNVVTPGSLPLRTGLAEPLESWAIHAIHKMGVLTPTIHRCEIWHHLEIYNIPNKRHFIPRLSEARVTELIERVSANATAANTDPASEFIFDLIGVFGSVLSESNAPGDVDIVFVARFKRTGRIIPESDYYPFSRDLPTDRAGKVLRRGARRMDLSCHDLREVESIGAAYKVIWTREKGRATRIVAATKKTLDPASEGEDGILRTDAKCEAFRQDSLDSAPFLPPIELQLPKDTAPMNFRAWVRTLREEHLVTLLAHSHCSHPGPIRDCLDSLISEWRTTDPLKMANPERQLFPFLAASVQFGTWKWDPANGLVEGKPYRQRELYGGVSRYL